MRDVRYARSGDVDIAYEVRGDGPIDVVYVPGFVSHLDLQLEIPAFAALIERLERMGRVLVFDKRGTGCSGRNVGFGSLAERADDIRAVMDHAGWERASIVGVSEGGPLSVLFAASHPERVDRLALFGTFMQLVDMSDTKYEGLDLEPFLDFVEQRWGTGEVMRDFVHAPPDDTVTELLARYERGCATPALARDIQRANLMIDTRDVSGAVSVPTVVVHHTDDPVVPVSFGEQLAATIPTAEFVGIDADMHCAWTHQEWAPAADAIEAFLTGHRPGPAPSERVLATVLFTDIVGSTERAAALGDRSWRALLDEHDGECARQVARFDGRVVKHTGDGMLATFNSPARAVKCAQALGPALSSSGIEIRAGLHTGEVERRAEDVGGIAVHIAARVAALGDGGDVLVSRTVRDLVVGSDLAFADHGTHTLKGVPEPWQIYCAS